MHFEKTASDWKLMNHDLSNRGGGSNRFFDRAKSIEKYIEKR